LGVLGGRNLAERLTGKEGRKGARRGAIGALRAPEWRGEWTPDPGKEKPLGGT
jgi:hypothetical protein